MACANPDSVMEDVRVEDVRVALLRNDLRKAEEEAKRLQVYATN